MGQDLFESPCTLPSSALLDVIDKVIACHHFFEVIINQTLELDVRWIFVSFILHIAYSFDDLGPVAAPVSSRMH